MPAYRRPFDKGTLFVQFDVEFPTSFWTSPEKVAQLEAILPPRKPSSPRLTSSAEEVNLTTLDATQQNRAGGSRRSSEDDMDTEEERPQVACAQQ
jgi:DnaJ family protein A protein 2